MQAAFAPERRSYMLREHVVGPTIINFGINGAIPAAIFRGQDPVVMEGGAVFDYLAIAFAIPFFSCLIVTSLVARQVRKGDVARLLDAVLPAERWALRQRWVRGLALGGVSLVLFGLPAVALGLFAAPDVLPYWDLILSKASFGGLVALLTSPIVGWWALVAASLGTSQRSDPT